jgi:hypothetical protein
MFRYEYLDELPGKPVELSDPDYSKYKCRAVFANNVINQIALLLNYKVITDPNTIKRCNEFVEFLIGKSKKPEVYSQMITPGRIQKINEILDSLIGFLEK